MVELFGIRELINILVKILYIEENRATNPLWFDRELTF